MFIVIPKPESVTDKLLVCGEDGNLLGKKCNFYIM